MAFPMKKKNMDPPTPPGKKKGLMIAIGIGKPKMPPPTMPGDDSGDDGDSADAAMAAAAPASAGAGKGAGSAPDSDTDTPDPSKMEKAGVIRANHHCQNCENWEPDTGNCSVLGPGFAPDDACLRYFEELGEDEGEGGDSDNDQGAADASGGAAPAGM